MTKRKEQCRRRRWRSSILCGVILRPARSKRRRSVIFSAAVWRSLRGPSACRRPLLATLCSRLAGCLQAQTGRPLSPPRGRCDALCLGGRRRSRDTPARTPAPPNANAAEQRLPATLKKSTSSHWRLPAGCRVSSSTSARASASASRFVLTVVVRALPEPRPRYAGRALAADKLAVRVLARDLVDDQVLQA